MSIGDTITYPPRCRPDARTGRTWRQLTSGPGYTYPLYFFGDIITSDGRYLIYYRWQDDEVQNWKLDLQSGVATQMTEAHTPNCMWRFWDQARPARGVRDQMSTLNSVSNELLYFDSNTLRATRIDTLAARTIAELPADRVPCGIPGVSPNGRLLAMTHADRAWWESATAAGMPVRHEAKGVCLDVIDLASGQRRNVLVMDCWLTHADFCDERHIIFANPPTECGLLLTDIDGGYFTQLCAQSTLRWQVNHAHATRRGIQYETVSPNKGEYGVMGQVDPLTRRFTNYRTAVPIAHRGRDVEGRFCFADSYTLTPPHERFLCWFPRLREGELNRCEYLTEGFLPVGTGQHSHPHPSLTPDRRHVVFTAPDPDTRTNHIFLLDVADVAVKADHLAAGL